MNRHLSRAIVIQSIFEWDFRRKLDVMKVAERNTEAYEAETDEEYIKQTIQGIMAKLKDVDQLIRKAAPDWPIEQISNIDRSILRVAIYELIFCNQIPPKVAINEAVEFGKSYGSENSSKFINGVLGTIYRESDRSKTEDIEQKEKDEH